MRIAVCISGQPRTWRTAKDNILKYFELDDVQVDFFIHTWDCNSFRKNGEILWDRQYESVSEFELEEITKAFNPKKIELETFSDKSHRSVWESIFYSFMKSVWLKRQYELENDFLYDIVIKTRFDINFHMQGINSVNKPLNKFYIHPIRTLVAYSANNGIPKFPSEFNLNTFDDVYFYADSKTMDIISNIYYWYKDVLKLSHEQTYKQEFITNVAMFLGPGTILYKYLVDWGIHPYGEIFTPYYVVRKHAEDLKLDSLKDWDRIKSISFNWYKSFI